MIIHSIFLFTIQISIILHVSSTYTPTLAPSKPCQNILSFRSTVSVSGGPIGNCFNFSFSLNAGTLQLCGWNTTTGKPAMMWNKNEGYGEQGIGLQNNKNHEIPLSGMIQINMRDIKTKTIPTFNIGSTGSTKSGATAQNSEWYCLYGSNAAGVLGTTLLYSNYIEAQDFLFPTTYVNYMFISFTSCPRPINTNLAADILIQTITITDGFACTTKPTIKPTNIPTTVPISVIPTYMPSKAPTVTPTSRPTSLPSYAPSSIPSTIPTIMPTMTPSNQPSRVPTVPPTYTPSSIPSYFPSKAPSVAPTQKPTNIPSSGPFSPTAIPSNQPSTAPTYVPSETPTNIPSTNPTTIPTVSPTYNPSVAPTSRPSISPTSTPTYNPSAEPTFKPTVKPSTLRPSVVPTYKPTTVGNIAVTQCALYQNPFNDASFQGFFIVHQTLSNTNASELSSTSDAIASFIQAVQCSMSGVFALRTVNVTITEIKAVTSTTQSNQRIMIATQAFTESLLATESTIIKYVVEFKFPLSLNISQSQPYAAIQQYFNGLVAQMTANVNQGKFSSIFQQYLLLNNVIISTNGQQLMNLMQTTSTVTPNYFGPYLKTVIPSLAPVENVVKNAGVTTTTQIWSQLAIIIGTISGILCIFCCVIFGYYYYIRRKRNREEDMDKWAADDKGDIQVFKKYQENPGFGQDSTLGRSNNAVSRAIDAVKRFSLRTSMRFNRSPVGAGNPNFFSDDVTNPMDIELNCNSNRSNENSVFQKTAYTSSKNFSSKLSAAMNESIEVQSLWTCRNVSSTTSSVADTSIINEEYQDEEEGIDYSFGSDEDDGVSDDVSFGVSHDHIITALHDSH